MKKIRLTQENAPLLLIIISVLMILGLSIAEYGLVSGIIYSILFVVIGFALISVLHKLIKILPKK